MKIFSRVFSILLFGIGLSAVVGGLGLIFLDGLGMEVSSMQGVFTSFLIPALILTFIVGGTHIIASVMLWKNKRFAIEATGVAGFGMLIWIYTELYIIETGSWLHNLYFIIGIATLVATMILFKFQNQKSTS
jgi:hypothetical protein